MASVPPTDTDATTTQTSPAAPGSDSSAPSAKPRRWRRGTYALIGLAVLPLLHWSGVLGLRHLPGSTFEAGHMPACDSSFARHQLRLVLEQSPDGKQAELKVLQLGTFSDLSPAAGPTGSVDHRSCRANVYTNAGHDDVDFTMEFMNSAKDEIYTEVTDSPF